jgi:hypothetical protein
MLEACGALRADGPADVHVTSHINGNPAEIRTAESTLDSVLRHSPSADATLGALFTLAREDAVADVRVAGETVLHAGRAVAPQLG